MNTYHVYTACMTPPLTEVVRYIALNMVM